VVVLVQRQLGLEVLLVEAQVIMLGPLDKDLALLNSQAEAELELVVIIGLADKAAI
jgi:hypothetical protein